MTRMGQIRKEKAIFRTLRMRRRRAGWGAKLRFSRRNYALTVTYYDQLSWLNKQVKTLLRTQGDYGCDVVVSPRKKFNCRQTVYCC